MSNRIRSLAHLSQFFLFNPLWGQCEGEESKRLIYYFNFDSGLTSDYSECDENLFNCNKNEFLSVVNLMGLCGALVTFVKNFGSDEEVQSIHGSKMRLSMKEIEPNYWLSMSLEVPKTVHQTDNKEDSKKVIEYHDDELNDFYVQLMMLQIYENFFLFNGLLDDIWINSGKDLDHIRKVCSQFFGWFLPSFRFSTVNFIELFGAIQYLPLDQITYLLAQSFVNHVLSVDDNCKHVLSLYNEQLISSTLDLRNTRIIYRYLVTTVIPEVTAEEISESVKSKTTKKTRFVKKGVKIHCMGTKTTYLMNIYRSINGATIVLLFSNSDDYNLDDVLFKCDTFMAERLPDLAVKFGEVSINILSKDFSKITNTSDSFQGDLFRFVYFNGGNCAFRSNAGPNGILDHRKLANAEFVKLIIDINSDLKTVLCENNTYNIVEIVAKTVNESWLVVHESDARTLFSMLNRKNSSLVEASEESSLYISKTFKNLLFLD